MYKYTYIYEVIHKAKLTITMSNLL
jgi:hypothetical protein